MTGSKRDNDEKCLGLCECSIIDMNQVNKLRLAIWVSVVKWTQLLLGFFQHPVSFCSSLKEKPQANIRIREAKQASALPAGMPSKDYWLSHFPSTQINRSGTSGSHSAGIRSVLAFCSRVMWTSWMPLRKHRVPASTWFPWAHLSSSWESSWAMAAKQCLGELVKRENPLLAADGTFSPSSQACAPGPKPTWAGGGNWSLRVP